MKKFLLVLFIFVLSIPAYAATVYQTDDLKFDFYGSLRALANVTSKVVDTPTASTSTFDIPFLIQNNSRIGFRLNYKDFGAVLEMSLSTEEGSTDALRYRLAYGTWDINDTFSLAIGKMGMPGTSNNGNVFLNDTLDGYGAITNPRRTGAKLSVAGFDLYVVSIDVSEAYIESYLGSSAYLNPSIPSFALSYNLPKAAPGIVYAHYLAGFLEDSKVKTTVDSVIVGFKSAPRFGDFSIQTSGFFGSNASLQVGAGGAFLAPTGILDADGNFTGTNDATSWGVLIAPRYYISKTMTIEAGVGYADSTLAGSTDRETALSAYIVHKIKLHPRVTLATEVLYTNLQDTNSSDVKTTTDTLMGGFQLRYDF